MMWAVAAFFAAMLLIYVGYLLHKAQWWAKIPPATEDAGTLPRLTVVVPARNEAANIGRCLAALAAQDYPTDRVEYVIVDDHSTDPTPQIIQTYAAKDSRFVYLACDEGKTLKKGAIEVGIRAATGEIILTTDADCVAGKDWLRTMATYFGPEVQLVSGPVMLTGEGLFAEMQSLEFAGLIAVGAASMASGNPNMCNGANLAYRKTAFDAVGGFEGIDTIASGDDELLMQKIVSHFGGGAVFAKDPKAIVETPAQPDLQALARQRVRWVSKSTLYKQKRITWVLVAAWLAMLGFPVWLVLAIWNPWMLALFAAGYLLKALAEATVLWPITDFLNRKPLRKWLFFEQFAHIAYVLWVGIAGNLKREYEWKGRRVR